MLLNLLNYIKISGYLIKHTLMNDALDRHFTVCIAGLLFLSFSCLTSLNKEPEQNTAGVKLFFCGELQIQFICLFFFRGETAT